MRSQELWLVEQTEHSEVPIRRRAHEFGTTKLAASSEGSRPQWRNGNAQTKADQLVVELNRQVSSGVARIPNQDKYLPGELCCAGKHFISRKDVHWFEEKLMQEAVDKLVVLLINISEKKVFATSETL